MELGEGWWLVYWDKFRTSSPSFHPTAQRVKVRLGVDLA